MTTKTNTEQAWADAQEARHSHGIDAGLAAADDGMPDNAEWCDCDYGQVFDGYEGQTCKRCGGRGWIAPEPSE